MSFGQMKL
ncbi:hypothetical protein AB1N83_006325 [Pleurotus pulmonarius]